jgi:WD40 repeat protein/tRNA A-37 threonylcarbamoyl transferase component Bud32
VSDDSRLANLVSLWQHRLAEGRDVPAAELCGDRADLIPALEQRLDLLRRMNRLMESTTDRTAADPAARAHAVTRADETLVAPAAPPAAPPPSGDRAPEGYEILCELGRGGMAVVYKARQAQLERVTALKMILSGAHASAAELARLRAEAKAIACLQHPNIVQIYEVGEHGGLPYLALEFCAGGSLDRKLRGRPLPPPEAAELVEVVARAVQAAHEKGVIHRDLKPGNILLTADGTPKITDFGLAKRLDSAVTASGSFLGTPSYMAPEQVKGAGTIGPPADVYALGAVLYECLTGRPPFWAPVVADTLLQVLNNEPVPPCLLQPHVPRDLEVICLKGLHKDPARRYASARDLADDLRRFRAGLPITARPVSRAERAWRWCRRNPSTAGLLAAVALVLVLGAAVATALAVVAEGHARRARQNEQAAREEKRLADEQRERAEWLLYASEIGQSLRAWEANHVRDAWHHLNETRADFRGWEYRYLRALFAGNHKTVPAHEGTVTCARFSPDGTRLASGGSDGVVRVWDAAGWQELLALRGTAGPVLSVCFSPDGKRVAAAGEERQDGGGEESTVRVWDAEKGGQPLVLEGHPQFINAVCFSPDGRYLATASNDRTVRVWDARTGNRRTSLEGHKGVVLSVCFTRDGQLLSAGADRTVRAWDPRAGGSVELIPLANTGYVTAVCACPDGKRVVTAGEDGAVRVWDAATGKWLFALRGHAGPVLSVGFSPDGKRLASAGEDRTVRVWGMEDDHEPLVFKGHTMSATAVSFAPDGKHLASAGADGTVRVWRADRGQGALVCAGHEDVVLSACLSPDGTRVASADADDKVRVFDATTGEEAVRLAEPLRPDGHRADAYAVCYSPDGKRLAAGSGDNAVVRWDAETGQLLAPFGARDRAGGAPVNAAADEPARAVRAVCFSPDGKRLAGGSAGGPVLVWDAETGATLFVLDGHPGGVRQVAFGPDGRLASAGDDGTVKLWDVETGHLAATLQGPGGRLLAVCFSPDGKRLAAGGDGLTVYVWDAESGDFLTRVRLPARDVAVTGLAFSADGKRLIGTTKSTVRVWVADTGLAVLALRVRDDAADRPDRAITGLCISPDGTRLAAPDKDRMVRVWSAPPAP